ncbi:MAG: peptidoglycan DD-metalloendopeptidase family protein [Deltaproteobacteria bacterium]|nr:peptidoglycan DD-metalloendopeptidase family protein [Deltaproteobacteria bacterium]
MRVRYGMHLFLIFCLLIFPMPGHGLKTSAQAGSEDSSQIKRTIQKKRREAQKVLEKEMKLLNELERLDRRLEEEQNRAQKIARQLRISRKNSRKFNGEIEEISRRMKNRQKLFGKRLTAMYKLIRIGTAATLFSAESFPDLLMRLKYLSLAARLDSDVISNYQEDRHQLEEKKRILSREILLQRQLRQKNERRLRSFNKAKEQKRQLLHSVRMEKTAHMQALKELEKADEKLSRMMASLRPQEKHRAKPGSLKVPYESEAPRIDRSRHVSIVQRKGKLMPPVKGKIIERFGRRRHPRFNTVTFQKGIDIAATAGSEIKSIFNGRVVYSGWFPGYGKMIIIDHGRSYYSVYAHSSRLLKKVGDTVSEGELIGLVGETGSLKGPCLYFEIRHHGVPVNPLEWIRI